MDTLRRLIDGWRQAIAPRPTHCDECERPVPLDEGVRQGRDVWCSDECANVGWERQQW